MILWGNDFQPEGLWIAAVWEFREQTLIYCCSSLHLMHTISILKIMVFSNLTISALSLHLPAILFSLSAVSVGAWCNSETLCSLVSWSVWWRAWSSLEMITGPMFSNVLHKKLKLKFRSLETWELRPYLWHSSRSMCLCFIYAFIIYHCQTILAHFSASSQFPDVISSVPMGSISPLRCVFLASPWSLPHFSCFAVLWLSSLLDLGSEGLGGSPRPEMTGMAFLLSLLVPATAVMSSSQEGNYSKESPEQSPEEASPRSPKMEQDQGR